MSEHNLSGFIDEARQLHALDPNRHKSDATARSAAHYERKTGGSLEKPLHLTANYLGRLACLDENESAKERYLHAIIDSLVVQPEAISENRWRAHVQKSRDMGSGPHELNSEYFATELNTLQSLQKDSLRPWAKHVGEAEYPMWFKVYALEGLARLGSFHSYGEGAEKSFKFDRRRKDSFATFPRYNPEALQIVYGRLVAHHNGPPAPESEKSFYNGSFNHLYAQALRKNSVVVELPATPEDVQGEWIHYGDYLRYDKADKQKLMEAAADNWCIAGGTYAKNYLRNGSEFFLFHLKNPDTHQLSSTAAVAIRMVYSWDDDAPIVEEVSGADNGPDQDIHAVLQPMANDALLGLAGGTEYLEDMKISTQLSVMDRKWQGGEAFTLAELELIYEVRSTLGGWADEDVRLHDFRQDSAEHQRALAAKYGDAAEYMVLRANEINDRIPEMLERGIDMNLVVRKIATQKLIEYAPALLNSGVVPETLIGLMSTHSQYELVPALHEYGYDCAELINAMPANERAHHLESFRKAGIAVDLKELMYKLYVEESLATTVRLLCPYIDEIDLNELFSLLKSSDLSHRDGIDGVIGDVLYTISASALRKNADIFRKVGVMEGEITAVLEVKER